MSCSSGGGRTFPSSSEMATVGPDLEEPQVLLLLSALSILCQDVPWLTGWKKHFRKTLYVVREKVNSFSHSPEGPQIPPDSVFIGLGCRLAFVL